MTCHSVAQIRHAEQLALAAGASLMPLAGAAAAAFVAQRVRPGGTILAVAGPGNNGGDAIVAATRLRALGYSVQIVLPSEPASLPADAAAAWAGWLASGGQRLVTLPAERPDLLIDGMFGIGLNRPLDAHWQALVDAINGWRVPVLALDVPSGIDADSGAALGRPVLATWTLSFIATARGLTRIGPGREAAGECHLDTLGVSMPPDDAAG
ncbi:NAD(P)H-hydrate epimerase [Achromobacter piechaudii]|uniref:NAD(P)H-hydrate epimerase n=1 Tax=Achromobacter piechaudii TaxID=72556 RepID=UPI003DA95355